MSQAGLTERASACYTNPGNFADDGRFIGNLACSHCQEEIPDVRGAYVEIGKGAYCCLKCKTLLGLIEGKDCHLFGTPAASS